MRKRGTAIIETRDGILLTSISGRQYLLPGGGVNKGESRFQAAIRETKEETGLEPYFAKILFEHISKSHRHTVVLIKAKGKARPKSEVKYIGYYNSTSNLTMSKATQQILQKYLELKDGLI